MKFFRAVALATLLLPLMGFAQVQHRIPTTDGTNSWTGPNSYTQSPQVPEPVNHADAVPKDYVDSHGGANLPHVTQQIGGKGDGSAVSIAEEGLAVSGTTGTIAYKTDNGLGTFDCRGPGYDGGCLGPTPGLAMQDMANDIICYNSTGLAANVAFPPGVISIGTAANPTLKLPAGNYYSGASGGFGTGTQFNATYNNHGALEFDENLTATCPDGNVHTASLTGGRYVGFGVHGCAQGGCINVPGDSTTYNNGGPGQTGVTFVDSTYSVELVAADHSGADGITISGVAPVTGPLVAIGNNAYFVFGKSSPPYNPATDGIHYNINLGALDGWFVGPNVTYGYLDAPGAEFGHVVEVGWGGGMTQASNIFVNRGTIGIERPFGSFSGHLSQFRIDGTNGPGLIAAGGGDFFDHGTINNACGSANVAWRSVATVTAVTPGSGQTDGTWSVTGSGGLGTTGGINGDNSGAAGTNAVISIVISGGVVTSTTLLNPGAKYSFTGVPTFTPTEGGTPATFTVTMNAPLNISNVGGISTPFCDSIENIQVDDHFTNIANGISNSFGFGPDYSTGGLWPQGSAHWMDVNGLMEIMPGAPAGANQSITPFLSSIQPTSGTNPRVDQGG
jgi:hypothetical protein